MVAYYNEIDPYAAQWLRNLIEKGLICDGEVDTRSITDVSPNDLRGFDQCHFFAGIAGWSHALRLAGWPDDRQIWTGSCPCQPFSVAGKGKGKDDERHLWPHFFRLISACRPAVVMGEQVAGKAGYDWLDGVRSDLEGQDYACAGVDIPACAVNAPHIRQRLYWVAKAGDVAQSECESIGRREIHGRSEDIQALGSWSSSKPVGTGSCDGFYLDDAVCRRHRNEDEEIFAGRNGAVDASWHDIEWLTGADGKARRSKPGICLLANGVPSRVGKLRAYGNAIVPPLAAEVVRAFMES